MKINKRALISTVIILCVLISLFVYTYSHTKETISFCNDKYRDKSFMKTMGPGDTHVPVQCLSNNKKWYVEYEMNVTVGECNDISTPDQIRFWEDCGWMHKDYLFILFNIGIVFMILAAIGVLVADLYLINKKEKVFKSKKSKTRRSRTKTWKV